MKANFNVTGSTRKELVGIIGNTVGMKPVYKFMPTCAYTIGGITVEKDGTMVWDENTAAETIEKVMAALAAAGFTAEVEAEEAPETETAPEAADKADTAEETAPAAETDGLTVSLPKDGFTEASIGNLRRLVESKATLIMKALGADRLSIDTDGDKVAFPWWDRIPEPEETQAYMSFIAELCRMAKEAKRVTATEKDAESEKYVFRCFLLRLGFIGSDSKEQRKILMKRLSGSAAFPNKEKADAFSAAQKAKRDAAKASDEAAEAEEVAACE